ncbi:aminoglycoside phosphotransferase family protein [Halosquirtibacter xylanolyticus]|uniref:phosphotransferase enzyme family protein n=1 Tax=Halosquirtibacter xylanolyticus TaxID=3374599 RepID=UPI00374A35D8|nr:aminoglycoside phosphotransferase family protein [Prolixibacteraceae bacterium]
MNNDLLMELTSQFQLKGVVCCVKPLGEGFINDTFIVKTESQDTPNYILQRKNKNIFTDVPAMMNNILKVTSHLKNKVIAQGGNPDREAMTIIPAQDGKYYFQDVDGEFWAVCEFINDNITYQSAETPELAYAGGKGIGKFQNMLSDMKEPLVDILPGFHNIKVRYEQWDAVIAKDPVGRAKEVKEEIEWIESRRAKMMEFWSLVEDGTIPSRVTHNDTKINNILFDEKGDVLCVIDLDTVLNSPVLNDYGDALRSYTNTGLEDDENLGNVTMDWDIFKAYTEGYLSESKAFLTESEIDWLAFGGLYITYEQVLRFLMDYIDGDNYYKTKSEKHNLVRTRAQYALLKSMEGQYEQMKECVLSLAK